MRSAETCKLAVEGLEATQATQSYKSSRHLDAGVAEPDNAVPLVAGKPLAVRVYPDLRRPSRRDDDLAVDGELLFLPAGTAEWQRASRFPGRVRGRPAESIDRGDPAQTLNFRIPEEWARATLGLRARVWLDAPGSERRSSDWFEEALSFVETRPLRLRLYGVHYRGRGLDLGPPTAAEALHTVRFLRKTYPVSRVEVLSYETIDFSGDLTDRSGARCGRGWSELLLRLSRLRAASGSGIPHYALLPAGVPADGYGGFGSALGIGVSFAGEGPAMAQELGHVLGLRHAPGGGAPDADPRYPAYGPYPSGSIGEYGFDPATGEVFSPQSCHDFMGYCGNYWVSPYTYRGLLDVLRRTRAPGSAREDARAPGVLARTLALPDASPDGLAGASALPEPSAGAGDGTSPRIELALSAPGLSSATRDGSVDLRWEVTCEDPAGLTFFVRYSRDGGANWQPVDIGFEWRSCRIDLDRLPGGDDCRLQVIASTVSGRATAETAAFRVPRKPRRATIAGGSPRARRRSALELTGAAHSPDGFAAEDELRWSSGLEGPLGTGTWLTVHDLAPGEHEITLAAPDGLGGETRATTAVRVKAPVDAERPAEEDGPR